MIEIITEEVEMPDFYKRKFKKECKNYGSRKEEWLVIDTETNTIRYNGKFEDASLASHNLNKAHYRELARQKATKLKKLNTMTDTKQENCTTPVVRRSISLWMEGFNATGQSQGASMIGTFEAVDLDDAVKQYMETHKGDVDWDRFGRGRHAIWACEIFDNEVQARKSFG